MAFLLDAVADIFSGFFAEARPPFEPKPAHELAELNKKYQESLAGERAKLDSRMEKECPRQDINDLVIDGVLKKSGGSRERKSAKVFLACCEQGVVNYALIVQPKSMFSGSEAVERVLFLKKLQHALKCKFLLSASFAYQDRENLYLGTHFAKYGSLADFIKSTASKRTAEWKVKHMAAQLVLGLEYLHSCDIAHRNLKASNVLVFEFYLKIADFRNAKRVEDRTFSLVGSLGYTAPEILSMKGHGKPVDFWCLGILLYELLYRVHPFVRPDMNEYRIAYHTQFHVLNFPGNVCWTTPVNKFIAELLTNYTPRRLGVAGRGFQDLKSHSWFEDICFFDVLNKKQKMDLGYELDTPSLEPCDPDQFKKIEEASGDNAFAGY